MKPAYTGDRREDIRFQVVGTMPASLLSTEALRVLNLAATGALVEATLPLPENAEYHMQLVLERHVSEAVVKVRRVTEIRRVEGLASYEIGLEFLEITPDALEVITQLVAASQARL